MNRTELLKQQLQERILVMDGAMGSLLQTYELDEAGFRGERFADHPMDIKGNNEVLNLTQPDIVHAIHTAYLEAGADIITTNTFNGTAVSQAEYQMQDFVYEMNLEAARIASKACKDFSSQSDDGRPRFVVGSLGPANKTLSLSPDVSDPGYRAVTFDEIAKAYGDAARGLIDGGADLLLVETIFDTLNAKAAIFGIQSVFAEKDMDLPLMISGTITDASGRTLSGQTMESVVHLRPSRQPVNRGHELQLWARDAAALFDGRLPDGRRIHQLLPQRRPPRWLRRLQRIRRGHDPQPA